MMAIIVEHRLAEPNEGALQYWIDNDELNVALLDWLFDFFAHAFGTKSDDDKNHDHDAKPDIADWDQQEEPEVENSPVGVLR